MKVESLKKEKDMKDMESKSKGVKKDESQKNVKKDTDKMQTRRDELRNRRK